jgi:hypothetical protein
LPKIGISNYTHSVIGFLVWNKNGKKGQKLKKEKENPPKPFEKTQETDTAHEVKQDDTGTFKRYLRLADQLLSTDKNDDKDPSSSAA